MLRLGKMTDYAVVVMGQMAGRGDERLSATDLSAGTALPAPTVSQVLKALAVAGVVRSHRGARGGYSLARPPEEISVADIIAAIEGPLAITACVEGAEDACGVQSTCFMRGSWDRVNAAVEGALRTVTLADMIAPLHDFSRFDRRPTAADITPSFGTG